MLNRKLNFFCGKLQTHHLNPFVVGRNGNVSFLSNVLWKSIDAARSNVGVGGNGNGLPNTTEMFFSSPVTARQYAFLNLSLPATATILSVCLVFKCATTCPRAMAHPHQWQCLAAWWVRWNRVTWCMFSFGRNNGDGHSNIGQTTYTLLFMCKNLKIKIKRISKLNSKGFFFLNINKKHNKFNWLLKNYLLYSIKIN